MARGVQIGKVLKQTGLSVDTIRYHEKERLLREPTRSEGGYRLYGVRDVEHLLFVRKAQELGFTLAEIRELRKGAKGTACLVTACFCKGDSLPSHSLFFHKSALATQPPYADYTPPGQPTASPTRIGTLLIPTLSLHTLLFSDPSERLHPHPAAATQSKILFLPLPARNPGPAFDSGLYRSCVRLHWTTQTPQLAHSNQPEPGCARHRPTRSKDASAPEGRSRIGSAINGRSVASGH